MHKFKLYAFDADGSGNKTFTGKIIECDFAREGSIRELSPYDNYYVGALTQGNPVGEIFKQFGYTQYISYFSIHVIGKNLSIKYSRESHHCWFLERL